MRKVTTIILILLFAAVVFFISSCGGGTGSSEIVSSSSAVLLGGYTLNDGSTITKKIRSFAASNSDIQDLSTATLEYPNGSTTGYDDFVTGGITAENYYTGDTTVNYGQVSDPMTEYTQRQLYTDYENYPETFNGTYKVKLGDSSKDITLNQQSYLSALHTDEISTNAGSGYLYVTSGDTITLSNQTNANFRYLCRIYQGEQSGSTVETYWTSTDVRGLSWIDTDNLADFFLYELQAAENNEVEFDVPGGIFTPGSEDLTVVISAYDTGNITSDTDGDFRSLTWPVSEIVLTLTGI